ncbi:hypothetical protein F2P44_00010 [Massilia sp. CCM 8695]|uniref:VOC domain-containing protein n=1 Tax=Massilia frigida TaxID=2609281 RepID=A0ABX0N4T1_9BURK|nr:hypothetical protein [Massilia frigida]NHZ77689.1 hypothetical protein [Massilia frigida]
MGSSQSVFDACANVELIGASRIRSDAGIKNRRVGVAHFFVRAEDDLEAVSDITDRCVQNGLVVGEYIYPPEKELPRFARGGNWLIRPPITLNNEQP